MLTPTAIPAWFDKWFTHYSALLPDLPVPAQDPLDGVAPFDNEADALRGLATMIAMAQAHPPTGQEPDPAAYQRNYDALLAALEYVRRFVGGGANGGGGY